MLHSDGEGDLRLLFVCHCMANLKLKELIETGERKEAVMGAVLQRNT